MNAVLEHNACCMPTSTLPVEGALLAPASSRVTDRVEAMLRRGRQRVLLELDALTDIDAAGIGDLVTAFRTVRAAGGTLQITHAKGRVRRVLDVAGVLRLLEPGTRV